MKQDNIINNNDMDKEQLETNLAALELLLNEHNDKATDYKAQIEQLKKDLKDVNKPELTPMQLDDVYMAVEKAVEEFDFSDTDNFDIEYGVDYDGRVHCENHELNNTTDLVELICDKVTRLFKEAECPTDEENARDDKEAEELADNS
jgi:hypothetical protein